MHRTSRVLFPGQAGAVLPVGLILLTAATLLALSGTRLSLLDLRMSLNDERLLQATQQAQSLVDAVLADVQKLDTRPESPARCLHPGSDFDLDGACRRASQLILPPGTPVAQSDATINVLLARLPNASAPPAGSGYSAVAFSSVQLRIVGGYDGTTQGLGHALIEEGLSILQPANAGTYTFFESGS